MQAYALVTFLLKANNIFFLIIINTVYITWIYKLRIVVSFYTSQHNICK